MKHKLSFHFHNPNTPEDTVEYITKILTQANLPKLEKAIRDSKDQNTSENIDAEESLCR